MGHAYRLGPSGPSQKSRAIRVPLHRRVTGRAKFEIRTGIPTLGPAGSRRASTRSMAVLFLRRTTKNWAGTVVGLALLATLPAAAQVPNAYFDGISEMGFSGPTIEGGVRVHVVQQGDTLWSLSALYLGDALRWPELWALNPQVTNPHWLFPGDKVYLEAGGAPTQAASSSAQAPQPLRDSTLKPRSPRLSRTVGFLASKAYRESGTIKYGRDEKEHFAAPDEVYLELDDDVQAEVGQKFTIYRVDREIERPGTGDPVGRLVKFIGTLRVTDTSAKLKKAVIEKATEEIVRGDQITTYFQPLHQVAPRTNAHDIEGIVIASFGEIDMYAQDQYIFIDKGAVDGVLLGNRFQLRERGDIYRQWDDRQEADSEDFPWEVAGEALVVEVYEDHCLAVVTHSLHEFEAGQLAVMPKGL